MKNDSKFRNSLPPYLAYGILDESSITFLDGVLHANYVFECDGSVVHKIAWDEKNCDLHTYLHGHENRYTRYNDLKAALLNDCVGWNLCKDKCFLFLADKVSRLGNIYVHCPEGFPKSGSANYFPAAKIFVFSLPLWEKTSAYFAFLNEIKKLEYPIFLGERKCTLLLETKASKVLTKSILIADFCVPLAYLVRAAKVFVSAGIIAKEIYLRLNINEATVALEGDLNIYVGDHEFPKFGVYFSEVGETQQQDLLDIFRKVTPKLPS
jgi:hypothetical protein